MSKYYKAEDIDNAIREAHAEAESNEIGKAMFHLHCVVSDLPTIEVSEGVIGQGRGDIDWQAVTSTGQEIYAKGYEDGRKSVEVSEDCSDYYKGYCARHEDGCFRQCKDAPSVVPTNENEIKLCRNCDNAYLYQDCLYCDEIEEETEIEPDDACSLWKLRESSVKPKEGEWIKNALLKYGFTAPDMTVTELIDDAPSVIPQPKEGEWIKDNLGTVICSECKRPRRDSRINHTKFCNSCGARMKGADDYERAIEQVEHDALYEPTYNSEDGSM